MTVAADKLNRSQIAQLGGFASTRERGRRAMADAGSKGGNTTKQRYGREHFVRAAHKRWGRLLGAPKPSGAGPGENSYDPSPAGDKPAVGRGQQP